LPHAEAELDALQRTIDESAAVADGFLKETFDLAGHGLSARQLARYFERNRGFALATVTAKGEPRVAPVGAILHRAAFHVPTAVQARRVTHIRKRPAVSLTHFVLDDIAVIVHGRASLLEKTDPEVAVLNALNDDPWWRGLKATGAAVWVRIEPRRIYTWAARPAEYRSS
jgi:general stress protein 26